MFWILATLLAVIAALAIALPLIRPGNRTDVAAIAVGSHDSEVYRDQLRELDRDQAEGLISPSDANYARAEIGRRLIAAVDTPVVDNAPRLSKFSRLFAAFILVLVPLAGIALYQHVGSPGIADQPLAARLANPGKDINILIAKAEAHLANNPDDAAGWEVLAPIYLHNKRPGDSAKAWKNIIRLQGTTPERLGNMGEALVLAAEGQVTPDAETAFADALKIDPADPRARFYLANRLEQLGKNDEALAAFTALADSSPKDAPWLAVVDEHIKFIQQQIADAAGGAAPGNPTAEDMQAASGMNASDRQQMIATMVEGLDARLSANPDNFDGWMRLVRSYMVLGKADKAGDALARGLKAFPADGEQGKQLIALAKELGLTAEGKLP